ncbi:reverse transcriptase domain-containing protein [Tanacetum coccineum]
MESLCGYPFKYFLDAYKGYHQIKMAKEDEEKTTFITSQGIFCYSKMPFGLKNARETYQRLVDKAFQKQIGRNLEVYVDDLIIKSRTEHEIMRDIEDTFKNLREINMKLNPKKCTFRIEEAEVAFKQIKKLIAELQPLTAPMEKEELIVYLAAAREAVSAVLMTNREAKQMPVYFISRALQGLEINYTLMEKLVLALVHASKQLKRYFQAHTIIVIMDQPIKQVLSRLEVAERLQKWSIELDGPEASLILTNLKGAEFTYALRFWFDATNNDAEYESLIVGLRISEQMGVKNIQINVDSCLVANQVLVKELKEKSINEAKVLAVMEEEGDTWMTPIYNYLTEETLLVEKKKARAVRRKSGRILQHACRNKMRGSKGYTDRILLAKNACGCKKIDKGMSRLPGSPPRAKKLAAKINTHHVSVAILQMGNRYSRTLPEGTWKSQIPNSGNGLLYEMDRSKVCRNNNRENPFKDWCEKLCICQCFAFVKHPQANGLVEIANRSLGKGIETRLDEKSKEWIKELTHVLWAHHTMIKSSNGDTSFSLTYGRKPREQPAIYKQRSRKRWKNIQLQRHKTAKIKEKIEKHYNSKVRNTSFKLGDLVYMSNDVSHAKESEKLSPKWEGSYEVREALGNEAYKLRDRNRKLLSQTWNVRNLKKCYVHEM